jgi:hypothetical protein
MKRQSLVLAAVVVAVALAIALVVRRGGAPDSGTGESLSGRVYQNDSLGVRMRIPDSPGWTLRRDGTSGPDGPVATASHVDGNATVRLLASPATDETTVDTVFDARQRQMAGTFGVDAIDKVVERVVQEATRDVNGRMVRQWQAMSVPIGTPDGSPSRLMFMWLVTTTPRHALECIGLVRFPATPDAAAQERTDALLRDVAYILQSFEVR